MHVIGTTLITRLRPATPRVSPRLRVDDLFGALGAAEPEDEDLRFVGVEDDRRESRMAINQPRQRVEMRNRADEQGVLTERRVDLYGLEQARARAGENRQAIAGAIDFIAEVDVDAFVVLLEALAFG